MPGERGPKQTVAPDVLGGYVPRCGDDGGIIANKSRRMKKERRTGGRSAGTMVTMTCRNSSLTSTMGKWEGA